MPRKPSVQHSSVSVIVPVFNEQAALPAFHPRLVTALQALPIDFQIIYVDDGSNDETPRILQALAEDDPRVRALHLSRNFGHQAALTAGLDHADGEIVISLDGDGQHPPELIGEMLRLHAAGYEIVQTQRLDSNRTSAFKRRTAGVFYALLNRVGDTPVQPGAADFRLLSRAAADGLRQMREHHRFLRGMVSWMGFRTVILPYEPTERIAGASKYSLRKMVRLALDAAFSFSLAPLWIGLSVGLVFFLLACIEAVYVLSFWVRGQASALAPGWSSLMFMVLIVGGVLTTLLGFIGVYVGYIFQEAKQRPIYLLRPGPAPEGGAPPGGPRSRTHARTPSPPG